MPALSLAWKVVENSLGVPGADIREVWPGGHRDIQDAGGFYRFVVVGGGWACSAVELDAAHAHENTNHKFNMTFRGVGRYEFRQVF